MRRNSQLSAATRTSLAILSPLAASLLAAFAVQMTVSGSQWQTQPPEIAFLLGSGFDGQHVRSSVYYFILILIAAFGAIVPIEMSKLMCARLLRRPSLFYGLLLLHQIVTFADVIRVNASDWWVFLTYFVRGEPIDNFAWLIVHGSLAGRWPWPTSVSLLVFSGFLMRFCLNEADGQAHHRANHNAPSPHKSA